MRYVGDRIEHLLKGLVKVHISELNLGATAMDGHIAVSPCGGVDQGSPIQLQDGGVRQHLVEIIPGEVPVGVLGVRNSNLSAPGGLFVGCCRTSFR